VIVDRIDGHRDDRRAPRRCVSTAFSEVKGRLALTTGDRRRFSSTRLFELRLCRARADANTLFLQ